MGNKLKREIWEKFTLEGKKMIMDFVVKSKKKRKWIDVRNLVFVA